MANKLLRTPMDGTPKQISFANHAGDFSPTAANDLQEGTPTEGELVLLNLADGAAVQSAKIDLGVKWAESYVSDACIEMQLAAADADSTVDMYWNASSSPTAGVANKGGASGVAGAYTGYSADLSQSLKQLIEIGSMVMTDDAVDSQQIGMAGIFNPPHRYGSLILVNNTGQTICDTDDIEAHVVCSPIIAEIQS